MNRAAITTLFRHPLARGALIHLGLLGGGWALAAGIASVLGLEVSLLGLLLGYGVINVGLTAWLLRKRPATEPEPDETADALAAFAEEPLGSMIAAAKARLAKARRKLGRSASMYRPLDRLVRTTRRIERRLALEPDLRPAFNRSLGQDLPLIAETAEQYVDVATGDLSASEAARMTVAEGVLREAAERLERLAESDGRIDAAHIGLIRMDAHAEVLAQRISADTDEAARRAEAGRLAHLLRGAAKVADEQALALSLTRLADEIEALSGDTLQRFLDEEEAQLSPLVAGMIAEPSSDAARDLQRRVTALETRQVA